VKTFLRIASVINAILLVVAGIILLERFDPWRVPSGIPVHLWIDVGVGLLVLIPFSVGITAALVIWSNTEKNLPNYCTIFACVFGVLTTFYFLWSLS